MRKRFVGSEMKICEYELIFADEIVFLFDRFLHFNDHLSGSESFFRRTHDFCASACVFFIIETTAFTRMCLNANCMAAFHKLLRSGRSERNPVFVILNFFWYANDHFTIDLVCEGLCSRDPGLNRDDRE